MVTLIAAFGLLSSPLFAQATDPSLLLHWKLDEGAGTTAHDASGWGQTGKIGAVWTTSQVGPALEFQGTPSSIVETEFAPAHRLDRSSWTLSAWIKPIHFPIDAELNHRRLFMYGAYPQASFNVDITGDGVPSVYGCYLQDGRIVGRSFGPSTALGLNRWAFLAIVSDRQAGLIEVYINGILCSKEKLPPDFDPHFDVSGYFSTGSGWQNFWGDAAEVRLYRRDRSKAEIKGEFARLKSRFGVVETPAEASAEIVDTLQDTLAEIDLVWTAGDLATVRTLLASIADSRRAPPQYRSYADLRLAQSYEAVHDWAHARAVYEKLAAEPALPAVHRAEAAEKVHEMDRAAKGLAMRDPGETRVSVATLPKTRLRIFVSPSGNDSNPGTVALPLKTWDAARDRVRSGVAALRRGTVEVDLAPGRYPISHTFALTARDGGTAATPVVYRAEQPDAAVLYGGARLTGFTPVTDPAILERLPEASRGKVVQCDLKRLGITDYGTLKVRGYGQGSPPPALELYVNALPEPLARWPNTGFINPTRLVDSGDSRTGRPSVLAYAGDRPLRWLKAEDPWLFGYFQYLWADGTAKIAKIDPVAKTITTAEPYHYDGTGMTTEQGIKFYVFNLLEEIDMPGEWYLDRTHGILYLYPPADLSKSVVEISMLNTPMVSAEGLSHVRFEGLTFDLGRYDGIDLTECSDCQLVGCTVRRFAADGVNVHGGRRDMLLSCDIYDLGRRATEIFGGDRETLTPSGHVVANCKIHDFGRIDRSYTPGVQLEGVGGRVAHCLFYNCPSSAMRLEGNDHIVEFNEAHDLVTESDDQGAMELFRNPTYRGVVFRYNYFHDIGSGNREKLLVGQAGIRLDDAISGMTIYGNVFVRSANGIFGDLQINSGRDNVIDNNIFAESKAGISGGYYGGNGAWRELAGVPKPPEFITSPLYMRRYPDLALMLKDPGINHAWRNVFYRDGQDITGNLSGFDLIGNGVFDRNPGFMDPARGDFRLKPSAPLLDTVGFSPIPFSEIGLYRDAWRKSLP